MPANTCRLPLVIAVLFPIVLTWLWTSFKDREFERERDQHQALMAESQQRAQSLDKELERMREENRNLARKLPNAVELADLRARAAELTGLQKENERLRGELGRAQEALKSQIAGQVSAVESPREKEALQSYVTEGAVTLKSGDAAITGGWKLPDGRHGFAFVTPRVQEDGTVLIESRVATTTVDGANASGLSGFLTGDASTANYATMPGQDIRAVLRAMQQGGNMDLMAAPRVQTAPGQQAEISVLNENGQGVTMQFTPRVQADGMTVDLNMKTVIQMPAR